MIVMQALRIFALTLLGIGVALGWGLAQQRYTVCPQGPPTCPFKTIADAIQAAKPGDVVAIGPGTYRERLVLDKSLTLRGAGRANTIMRASLEDFTIVVQGTTQLTLEGVRIEAPQDEEGRWTAQGIIVTDQAKLSLHSALLTGGKLGIFVEDGASAEIYNTVISNYTDTAITVRGKAHLTLGYSVLKKNRRNFSLYVSAQGLIEENEIIGGVTEFSGESRATLRGNRFTYAPSVFYKEPGLRLLNDETRLYNNEFISYKIDVFGTTRVIMEGNKLRGQGVSFYDASSGVVANNEIINAKFGIFVRSTGSVEIEKNHITMNDGRGIEVGHAKATVRANTVSGNGSDGIVLFGRVNAEIVSNQVVQNQGWGIATLSDECYDLRVLRDRLDDIFQGIVTGSDNELKDNTKGDLCDVPESLKKP